MAARMVLLLRGINVGTAKRIAMADLRATLTARGYTDVVTLLQSGNVVLSASQGVAAVVRDVEATVASELGVRCRVIGRSAAAYRAAVTADPLADVADDPARHLIGFLDGPPPPGAAAAVAATASPPERAALVGESIYLWCPNGILESPFGKVSWPRLIGREVTMRNWTTATRLAALAEG